MSLPLVFLAWGIVAFIAAITLYSFRGFTLTAPGTIKQPFTDYTHWTVVGAMGVLVALYTRYATIVVLRITYEPMIIMTCDPP